MFFDEKYVDQARKFSLLGADDKKLAELFEVGVATIHKWMADEEDFREAILEGRDRADAEVVAALYKRAIGFTRRTVMQTFRDTPKGPTVTRTITRTYYPPDVNAAMFWLKNRRKDAWGSSDEEKNEFPISFTLNLGNDRSNPQDQLSPPVDVSEAGSGDLQFEQDESDRSGDEDGENPRVYRMADRKDPPPRTRR